MANFGILQNIASERILGALPPSGGGGDDDGIGGLLEGIQGLIGAFGKGSGAGNVSQPAGPQSYSNQQGTYGSQSFGQSMGQNLNQPSQSPQMQSQQIQQPQQQGLLNSMPNMGYSDLSKRPAFQEAFQAQQKALQSGVTKSPVMTVVDYSLPANQQRLWTVDTQKSQVLLSSHVAHGSGSGRGLTPTNFSNQEGSHATSLGTYLTDNPYQGKHGTSLRLKGLDSTNNNAFQRAVVVHGGNYIGPDKTGTSWGCFTVPNAVAPKLVGLTQQGTIIHAYAPNQKAMGQFSQTLPQQSQKKLTTTTDLPAVMAGIAHVESGGSKNPYSVLSKPTRGDRAYGKYQIMGANIPSWTKMATGQSYTPEQFVSNPALQEKTASYMIQKNLEKYGNPEDAFSVWFSGRPVAKAGNAKDVYGTTVPQYIQKASKAYLQYKNQGQNNNNPTFDSTQPSTPRVTLNTEGPLLAPNPQGFPKFQSPTLYPNKPQAGAAQALPPMQPQLAQNESTQQPMAPLTDDGVNWGLLASLLPQKNQI